MQFRYQLIGLLLIVSILPFLVAGVVLWSDIKTTLSNTEEEKITIKVNSVAAELKDAYSFFYQQIPLLTPQPELISAVYTPDKTSEVKLKNFQTFLTEKFPMVQKTAFYDLSGNLKTQVIVATDSAAPQTLPEDFLKTLKEPGLYIPKTQNTLLSAYIVIPLFILDEPNGYFAADLYTMPFSQVLKDKLGDDENISKFVLIKKEDGTFEKLYPEQKNALSDIFLNLIKGDNLSSSGNGYFSAAAPIGQNLYYLGSTEKNKNIDAFISRFLLNSGLFIFLIIFSVITVGLVFVQNVSKPVQLLSEASNAVIKGDYNQQINYKSKNEFGVLVEAFNQMIKSVRESSATLSSKVDLQTKSLTEKTYDLENQRKAILNILEDISEDKNRLIATTSRLNLAAKAAQFGIWELDLIKNSLTWDDRMYSLFGLNKDDPSNEPLIMRRNRAIDPDSLKKMNQERQLAISTKGVTNFSNILKVNRPDGSIHFLKAFGLIERDKEGKAVKLVGINLDVTRDMEVDRMKTEFISLASHQLRTPLSTINWYTESLLSGETGQVSPGQKQFLDEIYSASQRMVALVNSLLNVSRIELGTLIIEPKIADLVKLIKSEISNNAVSLKSKNIQITENYNIESLELPLDTKLMQMVLQNVITNSIKYSPDNSEIEIRLNKTEQGIIISIADQGIGIPKSDQSKIFLKLFRAENAKTKISEGNGLGLYLAKMIMDQSGGKIWFESEEGKGTTFYISLPISGMIKKDGTKELS